MSSWWWHLWHDPMRDNPWSWPVMFVILAVGVYGLRLFDRAVDTLRNRWQNRTILRKASTIRGPRPEPAGNFGDAASSRAVRRRWRR